MTKSSKPKAEPPPERNLFETLGITRWDMLIVGDGSGSTWERECGWGSVSIERATMECRIWGGLMNRGTVNVAEIMAYFQPLTWLVGRELDRRAGGEPMRAYQVHIVTDSMYVKESGKTAHKLRPKNGLLWASFEILKRQGFALTWHHLKREQTPLNSFSDLISKIARMAAPTSGFPEGFPKRLPKEMRRHIKDLTGSFPAKLVVADAESS